MSRFLTSDPCKSEVQRFDRVLHQRLRRIFQERYLSNSSQIKDFLCSLQHDTDQNSIIKLQILEHEPALNKHFLNLEIGKLSLLWSAILGHYYNSAELLVRSGADVNQLYNGWKTHQAIPDLNEKSTVLQALLQMDPSEENERLIRLVTHYGADLQARDTKGRTVLHIAGIVRRVKMLEMFLENGADVNIVTVAEDYWKTPLLVAAGSIKADEMVPLLVKYGADVSARNTDGENALHLLSRSYVEHVELARLLIEKGASLDDREKRYHYQPIHQAIVTGHNKLVNLYLDHGANVNSLVNEDQESPLHLAATTSNRTEVLETLLKHGAIVDRKTIRKGHTALHAACENKFGMTSVFQEQNIKLLLSAGANVLIEDHNGKTPFALLRVMNQRKEENSSVKLMLKTLALKKVCQPSIELKDERLIKSYLPKLQEYYQGCIEQSKRMKSTRLVETCTLFDLLAKCHCQITPLMGNPDFEVNFKNYDIREFTMYAEDIFQTFERVKNLYQSRIEQENVINKAVYHILPYVVVRRVVHYMYHSCEHVL